MSRRRLPGELVGRGGVRRLAHVLAIAVGSAVAAAAPTPASAQPAGHQPGHAHGRTGHAAQPATGKGAELGVLVESNDRRAVGRTADEAESMYGEQVEMIHGHGR